MHGSTINQRGGKYKTKVEVLRRLTAIMLPSVAETTTEVPNSNGDGWDLSDEIFNETGDEEEYGIQTSHEFEEILFRGDITIGEAIAAAERDISDPVLTRFERAHLHLNCDKLDYWLKYYGFHKASTIRTELERLMISIHDEQESKQKNRPSNYDVSMCPMHEPDLSRYSLNELTRMQSANERAFMEGDYFDCSAPCHGGDWYDYTFPYFG